MTGLVNCTLECNLKCEYCFEGNGDIKKCPDLQLINTEFQKGISAIDRYIDELYEINHCDTTTIIWHGGEPTLVEPRLMAEVMELQKEKGHSIKWQIQTNGTLLGKYIDVLKKYNVSVGISIDGLKEHHDKYRVMKNDNPTFDIIMDNIEVLKANEIPFSVLLTITDNNVKSLLDIYYFLTSKNISFSFNALYPRNNNNDNAELNEDYFSDAICELFDCWIEDQNNKTIIAPFEQIIEGLLLPERGIPACNWQKDCMESFIAMDTSGDLYPCEHWVGFNKMKFGNIFQGLSNAIGKGSYFEKRVELLANGDCKNCSIFKLCYGGCPWNAFMITESTDRADLSICKGRKKIIQHIYNYLKLNYKGEIPEMEYLICKKK